MQFIQHLAAVSGSAAAFALFAIALPAHAHICMEAPQSRVGPSCTSGSPQKPGPCGINTRSTKYVTEFKPGETITVTLNETINHESHYRIAFNPNGATFEDPSAIDDKDGKHPFVLLDGIADESAARQSIKVTLPNMTCDNCTLQLIQVMYDKTGNGFGNDDIYYSCADIVLKGTAASGDAGAGIVAPKPALDAGTSQDPLPPVQTGDAGAASDAGSSGNGSADSSTSGSTGGQQDAGTGTSGSTEPDDGDDGGGCAVAMHRSDRGATALGVLLALAALLHRRRQRG